MPYSGGRLYYYAKADNGATTSGQMYREGSSDLWYAYVPTQYTSIRFTSWSNPNNESAARNGDGTGMTAIPTEYENPTFYPDTSDKVIYNGGNRSGYWQEKGVTKDAEKYKSTDVVKIDKADFEPDENTYYVNSTFYDYYSDFELNGYDRKDYDKLGNVESFASHRNWVTFRQLSQAMSDYYKANNVPANETIYTGHYQPSVNNWGYWFADVAQTLGLYGWNEANQAFQVNNNSCKKIESNNNPDNAVYYRYATQKILDSTLPVNGSDYGSPNVYGTSTALAHFNEEFLKGENSKNAVVGDVYHNVAFPFTKVDRDNEGVYYWSFDSAATTLKLKENTAGNGYDFFLDTVSQARITDNQGRTTEASRTGSSSIMDNDRNVTQQERANSSWSQNLISSGVTQNSNLGDYPSNKYGFFPLNSSSADDGARYNYGFGTKLEFDFNLTSDGNVIVGNTKYPITFNFSGDDDIWVFIDGKLVLDMGGDHGRTSGCINFSKDRSYDYYYSFKWDSSNNITNTNNTVGAGRVFVSEVKTSANVSNTYSNLNSGSNPVTTSMWDALGITTDAQKEEFYKTGHTLTFYYMERGMWESNMRIQFNFPTNDSLEVSKEIKTNKVASSLKGLFDNAAPEFTVKNMVTHYGTQTDTVDMGGFLSQSEIRDYGSAKSGFALTPAVGAEYTKTALDGSTSSGTLDRSGGFALKSGESALFTNQFRRGSYLAIEENLTDKEKELYTTSWTVYENGVPVSSYDSFGNKTVTGSSTEALAGTGLAVKDNRIEKMDDKSGGAYNDYTAERRPADDVMVFRSYTDPDRAANTSIKVEYVNRVNTGSLIVQKTKADGSEDLTGTYTFQIELRNLGGMGMTYYESALDEMIDYSRLRVTLRAGESYEYMGIPVGTEFTITELEPTDGSEFAGVSSTDNTSTVTAGTRTVSGVISYDDTHKNYGEIETVTFVNRKQKDTVSIAIVKEWKNVKGVTVPKNVSFQLQRKTAADSSWQAVTGYDKFTLDPKASGITVSSDDSTVSWSKEITDLDKYSTGTTAYIYRIVEYSANNALLGDSESFNQNYTVKYTYADGIYATAQSLTLKATNTYSAIVMPETGVSPLFNFAVIGFSAVGIAVIALLIYKRKLQTAESKTGTRGGNK